MSESTAWMETLTGLRFDPTAEEPEYHLHDLIWGVARECRYGGQIKREVEHYSVAEHLVHMTRYQMRYFPATPRVHLRTLAMHDAQEGVLKDMTRPVKKHVPQFCELEDAFSEKMARRFGLIFPLPSWIKDLDNRIIVNERAAIMAPTSNVWATDSLSELPGVHIQCWSPRVAAGIYAELLRELGIGDGTY